MVATVAAAGILLAPLSASAHDELVSSDPAADATVSALPAEIALTFSGLVSTEAGANEIAVTDASGTSLVDGAPTVDDTVVTQKLTGEASGAITVIWKVVSSDGHPVSGQYSFEVTGAPTPTPTPSPTQTATSSPTTPVESPTQTGTPAPPPTDASTSGAVWPWIVGGILLAAVLGAVIYLLASRAKRDRDLAAARPHAVPGDAEEPSAGPSGPPAER